MAVEQASRRGAALADERAITSQRDGAGVGTSQTEIATAMDLDERLLYHQIHPLKLVTDVATATVAAALLWRHELWAALVVGFVPSMAVSAMLLRWADLEPYRGSAFGRYIGRFMTRGVELARLAGLFPLWGGAWLRRPGIIVVGAAWILACWLSGLIES